LRRFVVVTVVVWPAVVVAGCGTTTTSAPTTRPTATPATVAPSATSPPPSALDGLGPFFPAATVDARLRHAAVAVNGRVTGTAVSLDQTTTDAVTAADPAVAKAELPAGLPPDLERAVLVVYNDLVSRHSAFRGVLRNDAQYAIDCRRNGAAPAVCFDADADVAAARRLAAAAPPVTLYDAPTVPPHYDRTFDGEIDGVYFRAGFTPATGWAVVLNAC